MEKSHFVLGKYQNEMGLGAYFNSSSDKSNVKKVDWKKLYQYSYDHWTNKTGLRESYSRVGVAQSVALATKGSAFGIPDVGFFIYVVRVMFDINLNCELTDQNKVEKLEELPVILEQVSKYLSQFDPKDLTNVLISVCDQAVHSLGLHSAYMLARQEVVPLLQGRNRGRASAQRATQQPRTRICKYFNTESGCSTKKCRFTHMCSACGSGDHNRLSCRQSK